MIQDTNITEGKLACRVTVKKMYETRMGKKIISKIGKNNLTVSPR